MARSLLPLVLLLLPACSGGKGNGVPAPPGSDTTAPTCVLDGPAPFATGLTGALTLAATATDDHAVAAVRFQVDGADLAEVTAPPFTAQLADTAAYASGQHVVRAQARDGAGNLSPWASAVVSFGGSVAKPAGFTVTALPGSLASATAMAVAPDGRIFVCEQAGTLRVHKAGALLAAPFATLPTTLNGERGLLGVTFDPAFATNGYVYVYYTALTPAPHNRISRLTADPANPDLALPGSEVALVDLPDLSSATNHNGGALHFGPDGKLYAGVGENANGANAPDLSTPLGKLLRFNADGTLPLDNPFYGQTTGLARAIWAKGLRNPFTFAFQPGGPLLFLNDVGQGTWEEVDEGRAGADYGWPGTEGPTSAAGITGPRFAYGHSAAPTGQPASTGTFLQGAAIVGAAFDAPTSPWPTAYRGSYWFGDLAGGWVARLHLASGSVSTFATGFSGLRDLAFAPDGALLVLTASGLRRITGP